MAEVLILTLSDVGQDVRVLRQVESLRRDHSVTLASPDKVVLPEVNCYPLRHPRRKQFFRLETLLSGLMSTLPGVKRFANSSLGKRRIAPRKRLVGAIDNMHFDAVIANDVVSLPLAFQVGDRVILDAHEYAPQQDDSGLRARFSNVYKTWLCRRYLHRLTGMMTVSEGIARLYSDNFGIPKPKVIRNIPARQTHLRPSNSSSEIIELVHHGISTHRRGLEVIIKAVDEGPPNIRLNLMIAGEIDGDTQEALNNMKSPERVVLHPPVQASEIASFINRFDLAIFAFPPNFANSFFVLPNKFFEAVQARIGIISAPSPDMAEIIKRFGLGLVADDFDWVSLVAVLYQLTPEKIHAFKKAADNAAELLCWENESDHLHRVVIACLENA